MKKDQLLHFSILAALVALTLWAYWGVWNSPFHFDDALFLQSPHVTEPGDPWYLLKPTQTRQLAYLSFYWNYRLWGARPAGYHLVNLLLHCLNILGVYLFMKLLFTGEPTAEDAALRRWLPIATAGIFALHPIQSEAVNYVYQRSTLLAGLFSLAALAAFICYTRAHRRWIPGSLAAAFFVLACFSKETALVLPLVMVILVWIQPSCERETGWSVLHRRRLLSVLFAFMLAGSGWILYSLHKGGEQTVGLSLARESFNYLFSQVQVISAYIRMLIWPTGLTVDHGYAPAAPLSWFLLLSWLLLIGLISLFFAVRRTSPAASFLGLGFFILLAPTSSVIPSADLMFEHRLYLPMIAGSALLAWLLFLACLCVTKAGKSRAALWLVLTAVTVTAYAAATRQRTYIWGDNIRLWSDAVAKAPGNPRAHYNLGVALLNVDRLKAYGEFEKTVRLRPDHGAALYNLGWLNQTNGNFDSARAYYTAAIKAGDNQWQAHQNLANLAVMQGRFDEAIREYNHTIRLRSSHWPAYQSLAAVQIQAGNAKAALEILEKLMQLQPELLEARYLRAYALVEIKRLAEAEEEMRVILSRDSKGEYLQRIHQLRAYADSLSK